MAGSALATAMLLMIPAEWLGLSWTGMAAACGLSVYVFWALPRVPWSRWIFVGIAAILVVLSAMMRDDFAELLARASQAAAFIAAFFVAQATLRHAAMTSPAIAACGRHLASQAPGRRYLALTSGGHLFGLVLSYGAISLLGGMATANASAESDPRIRELRIKRMLLATQRGFISTLAWSPLAFSYAVSTSIIEGSSWAGAMVYGLVGALIIAGLGYGMDSLIKPATGRPNRRAVEGTARDLLPLAYLLAAIMGSVALIHIWTDVRIVGVVLFAVPIISLLWIAIQKPGTAHLVKRSLVFVDEGIPGYRSEIVLISMAAFIGTMGSALLLPLLGSAGHGLETLPGWAVLVFVLWIVPISGLFGMNPVLAVTLMAPLLPTATQLHVDPNVLVAAITAGWALGGAVSPFTATTLIVGMLGNVSAWRVGLGWNGAYTILAGVLLSLWVVAASYLQGLAG